MKTVNVTINGAQVSGRPGMTILELARENDIDIPTLCYRPELPLSGSCRLCGVEVEGSRTLVGSCHTPINEGMVIQTHSPKVLEARRQIIELLLASHSGNCFMCDKANICELRKIAADLDVGIPRFTARKRFYQLEDLNPSITRDLTKCILCRRCIRACEEHKKLFSTGYRAFDSKVIYDLDQRWTKMPARTAMPAFQVCPTGR
jgi:NADH-quinone oxidoreductase subunit G/NADP-reducing hydrogenase subunit HndD